METLECKAGALLDKLPLGPVHGPVVVGGKQSVVGSDCVDKRVESERLYHLSYPGGRIVGYQCDSAILPSTGFHRAAPVIVT